MPAPDPSAFDRFDGFLNRTCLDQDWSNWGRDEAADLARIFRAADWDAVCAAMGDSNRDAEWKEQCANAIGAVDLAQARPALVAALALATSAPAGAALDRADEAVAVACIDALRDWPDELLAGLPETATAAVERVAEAATSPTNRLVAKQLLERLAPRA